VTRYIQRHSGLVRFTHYVHLIACVALILTGLVIFVPAIGHALGFGTVQAIRIGHRIFAVAFILIPLSSLIRSPKGAVHKVKELFAPWDADDKRFMKLFLPYLFNPKKIHMPKQGETKSGQRLADGGLVAFSILIAISGIVLWAGVYAGPIAIRIALLVHDVSFLMIAVIGLAHGYLGAGIFQPYRGSARLMFGDGRVSESDALYHWGHWAAKELASGKNVVEE